MTWNWFLVVFRHKFLLFCDDGTIPRWEPSPLLILRSHPLSFDNGGLNSVERAGQSMRGPNVSYQISLPNLFTIAAKITFGRLALKTVAFNVPQKMPNKTFKQNQPQYTEQENLLTILGLIRGDESGDHLHATQYREPVLQTLFLSDLIPTSRKKQLCKGSRQQSNSALLGLGRKKRFLKF